MTVKELLKIIDEWKKKGYITDDSKVRIQDCYLDYVIPIVHVSEYTGNFLIDWK